MNSKATKEVVPKPAIDVALMLEELVPKTATGVQMTASKNSVVKKAVLDIVPKAAVDMVCSAAVEATLKEAVAPGVGTVGTDPKIVIMSVVSIMTTVE